MSNAATKAGNSQGLSREAALTPPAHRMTGDKLSVEVQEGHTAAFTPIRFAV